MINHSHRADLLIIIYQIWLRWGLVAIVLLLIPHGLQLIQKQPSKAETGPFQATLFIAKHPSHCWYGYRQAMLEVENCQQYPLGSLVRVKGANNPSLSNPSNSSATVFWDSKSLVVTPLCALERECGSVISGLSSFLKVVFGLKKWLLERVVGRFSFQTEQLFQAMVFGDRDLLTDTLRLFFETTGMLHVLAVSGMHVGLLYGLSGLVFHRFWRPLAVLSQVIVIIFYGILVGAGASVLRASLMLSLGLILRHFFKRPVQPARLLLVSATLMVVLNPWFLTQVSFQLSVAATGIIIGWLSFGRWWRSLGASTSPETRDYSRWTALLANLDHSAEAAGSAHPQPTWRKILNYAREVATLTLVIQICLAPLLWWHFGSASWLGILAAPASLWLAGPFFTSGVAYLSLSSLSELLGRPHLLELAVTLSRLAVEILAWLMINILGALTNFFQTWALVERLDFGWRELSWWYASLLGLVGLATTWRKLSLGRSS